jgi:acetyltransferase-like isoleucine patch superfamily enzyme
MESDRHMGIFWRRVSKAGRILASRLRLLSLRRRFGVSGFPTDLMVASATRFLATDGGVVEFAEACSIDRGATIIAKQGSIRVGAKTYIGIGAVICARETITIGSDVLLAEYVTIRDQDHIFGSGKVTARAGFTTAPIVIGDNVWIGAKTTITKGVKIGNNSVVGANSVVTCDVPANTLVAGVPARVLRQVE